MLAVPAVAEPRAEVRNVIYLVGDGMGRTHVTAARGRFAGAAGRLAMERLPVLGQVATWAVEEASDRPALVTDSASSATAWSSGVKTYNAAIGVDAYGRRVDTLMEQARAAGLRTGNVSTAEVTDATPAAMMSHALLRGCQGPTYSAAACVPEGAQPPADRTLVTPIAEQIARGGAADVVFGGALARSSPTTSARSSGRATRCRARSATRPRPCRATPRSGSPPATTSPPSRPATGSSGCSTAAT